MQVSPDNSYKFRDFSSLPPSPVKGPVYNGKYSKITQNSQNFNSYPFILIPKWPICQLEISQKGT
jgi:hypothetical protein